MASRQISMFAPHIADTACERVTEVLRTPMIGQGALVDRFEEAIQAALKLPYVVALNASSSALRLALTISGVKPGDDVITTPLTCTLTNHPILEQFAVPVFADIESDTGNIDPVDVERRITPRTRAILCTHWAGTPCDLDELNQIARRHAIPVIEDASEAFGASYRGRPIGAHSRFVAYSFHAVQILTTAEGGALAVQTEADAGLARMQRWYGIDRGGRRPNALGYYDFDVASIGFGYHLTNLAAAIGLANLETIPQQRLRRRALAELYWEGLKDVAGVTLLRRHDDREPSYHFFTLLVDRRLDFCRMMRAAGVSVSIVHARNDEYTVFGGLRRDLPCLDLFAEQYIGLPLHMKLSDDDVGHIVETIRQGW